MSDIPSFGIQSWCFRNYRAIDEFTAALKQTGVAATELCGVQVDFSKPETFDQAIDEFNQAGVKILSTGVHMLQGKPEDRQYFEFTRKAGGRYMSVSFRPEGMWEVFRQAEKLAEEYDLKLGIHNHGGYDWLGNAVMLDYVLANTSDRIGLTLDTAWAIDAKLNPVEIADQFASRLVGVHIKDFTYTPDRKPHDVIIGQGNLNLPLFMETLRKNGFEGFTVIEYEADVDNPVPALTQCVQVLGTHLK